MYKLKLLNFSIPHLPEANSGVTYVKHKLRGQLLVEVTNDSVFSGRKKHLEPECFLTGMF